VDIHAKTAPKIFLSVV